MMLTIDSKVKELKKNEKVVEIISKVSPGFATDPQMKLVQGLTLRKLMGFPQSGMSAEQVETLAKELEDAQLE